MTTKSKTQQLHKNSMYLPRGTITHGKDAKWFCTCGQHFATYADRSKHIQAENAHDQK